MPINSNSTDYLGRALARVKSSLYFQTMLLGHPFQAFKSTYKIIFTHLPSAIWFLRCIHGIVSWGSEEGWAVPFLRSILHSQTSLDSGQAALSRAPHVFHSALLCSRADSDHTDPTGEIPCWLQEGSGPNSRGNQGPEGKNSRECVGRCHLSSSRVQPVSSRGTLLMEHSS